MNIFKSLLIAVASPCLCSTTQATDFSLFFEDTNSGINWSGIVDTSADTLTITEWSATNNAFYPQIDSLPMKFNAVSGAFGDYDIPDNWDGSINNWGFISEHAWTEYRWTNTDIKNGADFEFHGGDNPAPLSVGISLQHTLASVHFLGDEIVFTPEHFARTYKNEFSFADVINDGGTPKSPTKFAVKAVPEPSSVMLLFLGVAGCSIYRKR